MSADAIDAIVDLTHRILIDELIDVTPAMVEAGSRASLAATTVIDGQGKRQPRMANEAAHLAAIWRAMLAVKLGGGVRCKPAG